MDSGRRSLDAANTCQPVEVREVVRSSDGHVLPPLRCATRALAPRVRLFASPPEPGTLPSAPEVHGDFEVLLAEAGLRVHQDRRGVPVRQGAPLPPARLGAGRGRVWGSALRSTTAASDEAPLFSPRLGRVGGGAPALHVVSPEELDEMRSCTATCSVLPPACMFTCGAPSRWMRMAARACLGPEPVCAACRGGGGGGGVGVGRRAGRGGLSSRAAPECQCRFVRYETRGVRRRREQGRGRLGWRSRCGPALNPEPRAASTCQYRSVRYGPGRDVGEGGGAAAESR